MTGELCLYAALDCRQCCRWEDWLSTERHQTVIRRAAVFVNDIEGDFRLDKTSGKASHLGYLVL